MMNSFFIKIQKILIEYSLNHNKVATIFLFGSILKRENVSDIDILLVYPDSSYNKIVISLKKSIQELLQEKLSMQSDICMLTEKEDRETKFSLTENAVCIYKINSKD